MEINMEFTIEKNNKLRECLSCSPCKKIFHYPVTLFCQDNFCKSCLKNYIIKTNKQNCPICQKYYLSLPIHNFKINDLINILFPEDFKKREIEISQNELKLSEEEQIKEEIIKNNWRNIINKKNDNEQSNNVFTYELQNYII